LETVLGVDTSLMWAKIYDVIIKSLLSVDSVIYQNLKKLPNRNNCFELLGYDILIDSELKPWLMEVNLSPSLATDSPLDVKIKSNLLIDTLNLVGIRKFDRRRDSLTKMKNRVKNIMRAKSYQSR
jgi:tubulin polyglutamylase TTLL5